MSLNFSIVEARKFRCLTRKGEKHVAQQVILGLDFLAFNLVLCSNSFFRRDDLRFEPISLLDETWASSEFQS